MLGLCTLRQLITKFKEPDSGLLSSCVYAAQVMLGATIARYQSGMRPSLEGIWSH
ncbi:hypothetical protein M758_9G045000 [Ceratodon purpureus]|nr:hypothetical protein M758_9G045000 [Ceratodon purpureus]